MLNTDVTARIYLAHAPKDEKHLRPLLENLWEAGFILVNLHRNTNTITINTPHNADATAMCIAAADQMLFALSPRSANSAECQHELELALRLNKRIIPAVIAELKGAPVPVPLSRLSYIFFTPPTSYELSFATLKHVMTRNLPQVQRHAHYSKLALRWEQSSCQPPQLLSGKTLEQAEQWLLSAQDSETKPASLHQDFISSSRQQETQNGKRRIVILFGLLVLSLMSGAYGAVLFLL